LPSNIRARDNSIGGIALSLSEYALKRVSLCFIKHLLNSDPT